MYSSDAGIRNESVTYSTLLDRVSFSVYVRALRNASAELAVWKYLSLAMTHKFYR